MEKKDIISLNLTEKQTINKAKKYPGLKTEIQRIYILLASNKAKNISKL